MLVYIGIFKKNFRIKPKIFTILKNIYNSLLPSMALARVTSSAYSKSAPTGSPNAIRDIFIPKGLISFVKYKLVASPSTEGDRARITIH